MGRKDVGKDIREEGVSLYLVEGLVVAYRREEGTQMPLRCTNPQKAEGSQVTTICGCSFAIYSSAILLMSTRWRCPLSNTEELQNTAVYKQNNYIWTFTCPLPEPPTQMPVTTDKERGQGSSLAPHRPPPSPFMYTIVQYQDEHF